MRSSKLSILLILCIVAGLVAAPSVAQSQGGKPLPPLPDAQVIARVLKVAAVRGLTSIASPGVAVQGLPSGVGANLDKRADTAKGSTAFGLDAKLQKTVLPLIGAEKGQLKADAQTPDDKQPAQTLGVISTADGTKVAMLVFKDGKPSGFRFYDKNGLVKGDTDSAGFVLRQLQGTNSGVAADGDQGVLIGARETCFTVGLAQACYTNKAWKKDDKASTEAEKALKAILATYAVTVRFDTDGALVELLGNNGRKECSDNFSKLSKLQNDAVKGCQPNLVFAASWPVETTDPIGLFSLLKAADIVAFDPTGKPVQSLPAGSYLVINATPDENRGVPGAPGALFLVNANGKDNFLIPSQVVEGFGETDVSLAVRASKPPNLTRGRPFA